MSIFGTIFGGGTTGASEAGLAAQIAANKETSQYIDQQTGIARGDIAAGLQPQVNMLQQGAAQAQSQLNPYTQTGINATQLMGNLSGASGMDAQQQAFSQYQASPEQAYLQQQGEQALLRNQAAMGGLGGGNVRRELQQQGIGMAAQDYQNHFARLAGLAGTGAQTGTTQAQLSQQAGADLAGVYGKNASSLADIAMTSGAQKVGIHRLPNLERDPGIGINNVGEAISGLGGLGKTFFGDNWLGGDEGLVAKLSGAGNVANTAGGLAGLTGGASSLGGGFTSAGIGGTALTGQGGILASGVPATGLNIAGGGTGAVSSGLGIGGGTTGLQGTFAPTIQQIGAQGAAANTAGAGTAATGGVGALGAAAITAAPLALGMVGENIISPMVRGLTGFGSEEDARREELAKWAEQSGFNSYKDMVSGVTGMSYEDYIAAQRPPTSPYQAELEAITGGDQEYQREQIKNMYQQPYFKQKMLDYYAANPDYFTPTGQRIYTGPMGDMQQASADYLAGTSDVNPLAEYISPVLNREEYGRII